MNWEYEEGRVYSSNADGELMAETTFVYSADGEVNIDHTFVNTALRGQGVAGKMMKAVADHLREKELKAVATCSYANVWLEKHADAYADIISNDFGSLNVACRIDGKH